MLEENHWIWGAGVGRWGTTKGRSLIYREVFSWWQKPNMAELLPMWRGREFQVVGAATAKLREPKHVRTNCIGFLTTDVYLWTCIRNRNFTTNTSENQLQITDGLGFKNRNLTDFRTPAQTYYKNILDSLNNAARLFDTSKHKVTAAISQNWFRFTRAYCKENSSEWI